ncbi:phenylalanine--tRNA ligase subunit beta [Mycoplasma sp. 'Moose RK']|uniref:phenylalanine--tRNA ligase subunit beta n=1 Tax=Mycoplasma sp. 'Moose RK' TaxID=2780095 RepID=UPI0018C2F5FF|nr:phenylalanine--tRNA ligase subunit beta [Mycoplasma sp. 'Moose RK']MBG0730780.1 phenylalanine--tRNA ligase subunit beta [Mycoplasma sp. 'Moose RK']
MLFSLLRLKKLANLTNFSDEIVIQSLINLGFEVDSIRELNYIDGIRFGLILEVEKNPNADNLLVCKIQFADRIRTIQTRAQNIIPNKQVLAFVPGSINKDIIFESKMLRGLPSEGMLISLSELGFDQKLLENEESQGIFLFEPIFDLDLDPLVTLELKDKILDIKLLWNRPDANSYLVIAMELAAYFSTKFNFNSWQISGNFSQKLEVESEFPLQISALEIEKAPKISLADQFLLLKSGISIKNDPRDFANFVLIYTGQPCFLVPTNKLPKKIRVIYEINNDEKNAKKVPVFKLFFDDNQVLIPEVLEPKVLENQPLLLILPKFDLVKIRQSFQKLKINTPTAKQLARNYSIGTTLLAFKFLNLFLKNQEINFSKPINFDENLFQNQQKIHFNFKEINQLLGLKLVPDRLQKTNLALLKIGYNFLENQFLPPFYRVDIEFLADLAADFLRFYGLDSFEENLPQISSRKIVKESNLPIKLQAFGFFEANTYLLVPKSESFNPFDLKSPKLITFSSHEHVKVRYSLAFQLSKALIYNVKRKMVDVNFFEIGSVAEWNQSLALASTDFGLEELKQKLKNLFPFEFDFIPANSEFFEPKQAQFIYLKGVLVGWVGKINTKFCQLKQANFLELLMSRIDFNEKRQKKFTPYENAQLKFRDITISLDLNDIPDRFVRQIEKIPGIFSVKQKDYVIINEKQKITYRITGSDQACDVVDVLYNR